MNKVFKSYDYLILIAMVYIAVDLSSMVFAYKFIEIGPLFGAASSFDSSSLGGGVYFARLSELGAHSSLGAYGDLFDDSRIGLAVWFADCGQPVFLRRDSYGRIYFAVCSGL